MAGSAGCLAEGHRHFWFNFVLAVIVFLLLLHTAGAYLGEFRFTWLLLAVLLAVVLWAARHLSALRFFSILALGAVFGYFSELLGTATGCWAYAHGDFTFGVLEKALTAVALYALMYAVDRLITGLRLPFIPFWVSTLLVTAAYTVLILTSGRYTAREGVVLWNFWLYYPALFLTGLAYAGQIRAVRMIALLAVAAGASVVGEYIGGYMDRLWTFTSSPDFPPAFLTAGAWPLEFLTLYVIVSLLFRKSCDTDFGGKVPPWRMKAGYRRGTAVSLQGVFKKSFSATPGLNEALCCLFGVLFLGLLGADYTTRVQADPTWSMFAGLALLVLLLGCISFASRMHSARFASLLLAGAGFHYIFMRAGGQAGIWTFPGAERYPLSQLALGGLLYVWIYGAGAELLRLFPPDNLHERPLLRNRFFTGFSILVYLLGLALLGERLLAGTAGVFLAGTGLFLFFFLAKTGRGLWRPGPLLIYFLSTAGSILGFGALLRKAGLIAFPLWDALPHGWADIGGSPLAVYYAVLVVLGFPVTFLMAYCYSAFAAGAPLWRSRRRAERYGRARDPITATYLQNAPSGAAWEKGHNSRKMKDGSGKITGIESRPPPRSVVVIALGSDGAACARTALERLFTKLKELDICPDLAGKRVFIKPNLVLQVASPVTVAPEVMREVALFGADANGGTREFGETALTDVTAHEAMEDTGLKAYLEASGRSIPGADRESRPGSPQLTKIEGALLDEEEFWHVELGGDLLEEKDRRKFALPRRLIESDLYINLAKMKTHNLSQVTLGIKNSQGLTADAEKPECHGNIQRKTVNITQARLPDIAVIDAFDALEGDGPLIGDRRRMGMVLAGNDVLAVDWMASLLMGFNPEKVKTLEIAHKEKRLGTPPDASAPPGKKCIVLVADPASGPDPVPIDDTSPNYEAALDGVVRKYRQVFRRPAVTFEGLWRGVLGFRRSLGAGCGHLEENETWHELRDDGWHVAPPPLLDAIGPLRFAADDADRNTVLMTAGILPPFATPLNEFIRGEMAKLKDVVMVLGRLYAPLECATALLVGDEAVASEPMVFAHRIIHLPGKPPRSYRRFLEVVADELDMDILRFVANAVREERGDYL